jgi:hypothetical protein
MKISKKLLNNKKLIVFYLRINYHIIIYKMDIQSHIDTITKGIKMVQKDPNIEMEMVYKTNVDYKIDKTTFNRVISHIKGNPNLSFHSTGATLDIFIPEEDNGLRYTIFGDGAIHSYCKSNNLSTLDAGSYILQRKTREMKPIDINNYNIRINFKKEVDEQIDMEIFNKWATLGKLFRYKKRYSFKTANKLFQIDCTIVKSSNSKVTTSPSSYMKKKDIKENMRRFVIKPKNIPVFDDWFDNLKPTDQVEVRGKKYEEMIPSKTIQNSNVLRNDVVYEIEIEYIGNKMNHKDKYENILKHFKETIEFVLRAIQNNPFIISQEEKAHFRKEYKELMGSSRFMGPQPTALEMKHVARKDYSDYKGILSIRRNYCVTDKADGERNVLFIGKNGKCYMINRKNEIKLLGLSVKNYENTVLDGEYVLKDKDGLPIVMFLAFDIYFYNNQDLRERVFNRTDEERELNRIPVSRHELLEKFFEDAVVEKDTSGIVFSKKKFYFGDVIEYDEDVDKEIIRLETELKAIDKDSSQYDNLLKYINKLKADSKIFEHSKLILEKSFPYATDGLIYTPINLPVGGSFDANKKPRFDGRWFDCFKWKPPHETTIDFRILFKKDPTDPNKDLIQYTTMNNEAVEYKTAVLYVGYNPEIHTSINSCRVLNEELIFEEGYNNVPFQPYNPYIRNIEFAYIPLKNGVAYTEEKGIITEGSIVEFRYFSERGEGFWWSPMRIRNVSNPNDFLTAINNWRTLHNPVLQSMISTGKTPDTEDTYYIKVQDRKKSPTKPLGDFHSYVKKSIITQACNKASKYLDLCCGKMGDMNHLLDTKLDYALCMDVSRDNLENKDNGACNRLLTSIKENKNKNLFKNTLIVWADASQNVMSGVAANDDLNKYYLDVIYGNVDQTMIENNKLQRMYGLVKDTKFDVVSCQFAIHYFFENMMKLDAFLQNVSENLNVGGKFIGTTMNGQKVFDRLKDTQSIIGESGDDILWKIVKQYDNDSFKNDESSVGFPVDVYINSIGKTTREWLVNFKYLEDKCKDYNLELKELVDFEDVYDKLVSSKKVYGEATKMNVALKEISFLFSYFIFEKV